MFLIRLAAIYCLGMASIAMGFSYFGGGIDYWNESEPPQSQHDPPDKENFSWEDYQNPANDEFFREGNHLPPKPLMELARDPSDENIKNWFELMDRKNQLMRRLQERLSDYLKRHRSQLKPAESEQIEADIRSVTHNPDVDLKRYRFRLYFESSCPHCKNMLKTMTELQQMGYYVEVHQIDRKIPRYPVPFPLIPAQAADLKARGIESWPVLLVADTTKQEIKRVQGFVPTNELFKHLN